MKGRASLDDVVWYSFPDPDDEETGWRVHVNFLLSNWECIFGKGCPGLFGKQSENTFPDIGCCTIGVHLNSKKEVARVSALVDQLTEDDIGPRALKDIRRNGFAYQVSRKDDPEDPDAVVMHTRVRDGGCILANRLDDGGRMGCALVHLGKRIGKPDHLDVMPDICWRVPLFTYETYDDHLRRTITTICPVDADTWEGFDEDGTHDSWMCWWCTDTADAYTARSAVYIRMERELREIMGDKAYEVAANWLRTYAYENNRPPMGAERSGRKVLPLLVSGRTAKRLQP